MATATAPTRETAPENLRPCGALEVWFRPVALGNDELVLLVLVPLVKVTKLEVLDGRAVLELDDDDDDDALDIFPMGPAEPVGAGESPFKRAADWYLTHFEEAGTRA